MLPYSRRLLFAFLCVSFLSGPRIQAEGLDQDIAMVASTSFGEELPFAVVEGRTWRAEKGARFVKVHMYLDNPVSLSGISVRSCDVLEGGVRAFINFDESVVDLPASGNTAEISFGARSARSVTLNFQNTKDLCLEAVVLKTPQGPLHLSAPRVVTAKVQASSTLKPELAYQVMNLFDSRMEYSWSSLGKGKGESLSFEFAEAQNITKIRIWNGYQRSDTHCQSNARAKTIQLTGDEGYSQSVSVADAMGGQEIALPKPFHGKNLKITFTDIYPGRAYKDLVISELRFFDGDKWFVPDPRDAMRKVETQNAAGFRTAGLGAILNDTLNMTASGMPGQFTWRFRKDGSFYMDGSTFTGAQRDAYYALGNFEIKKAANNELVLRVFGVMHKTTTPMMMDCNGCGRDCNKPSADGSTEGIFEQYIVLSTARANSKLPSVVKMKNATPQGLIQFQELLQVP